MSAATGLETISGYLTQAGVEPGLRSDILLDLVAESDENAGLSLRHRITDRFRLDPRLRKSLVDAGLTDEQIHEAETWANLLGEQIAAFRSQCQALLRLAQEVS